MYSYMMNKANLVENLQADGDYTKAQAEQIVEGMFNSIVEEVAKGETVSIARFRYF